MDVSSLLRRALLALPLLLFYYLSTQTMEVVVPYTIPTVAKAAQTGIFPIGNGSTIAINSRMYGIPGLEGLDDNLKVFVAFFMPSLAWLKKEHTLQLISFLMDVLPFVLICTVESLRVVNSLTVAQLAVPFGLAYQLLGAGRIAPFYFYFHYIQCSLNMYTPPRNRLVRTKSIKTLAITLLIVIVAPNIAMYYPGLPLPLRQTVNAVWQLWPLWIGALNRFFSLFIPSTTSSDIEGNAKADMPYLRFAYGSAALIAGLTWLLVWSSSPAGLVTLYHQNLVIPPPTSCSTDFIRGLEYFLVWDQVISFGAALSWVLLHFYDLKSANRLEASWFRIIATMVVLALALGPGSAMSLMWWWREETLAKEGCSRSRISTLWFSIGP